MGVQEGLDKLAQSSEFAVILHKEVQARKLSVTDVIASISHLYRRYATAPMAMTILLTTILLSSELLSLMTMNALHLLSS